MITRLTKIQLIIFLVVTVVGGAVVGGRYAKVDRLVIDRTFAVSAMFKNSGGIFEGAQVTYRGTGVGRVGKLTFTGDGVKVRLDIEKDAPKISSDVKAVVANLSAVGEQYVDLQPRTSAAPYLDDDSVITTANTFIPLPVSTILIDVNKLVKSVDKENLRTLVDELGTAFEGTGRDLSVITTNSMDFINTATDNIDVTRSLIRNSQSVLQTQIDKAGQIQSFASDLALLSDTLVDSDTDLRRLLDEGASSAKVVRQVIAENEDDFKVLLNNLVTANKPVYKYIDGVRALFILYPYIVNGAPSVVVKGEDGYEAHFGAVLTTMDPKNCTTGYQRLKPAPLDGDPPADDQQRDPNANGPNDPPERPFPLNADCTDPNQNLNPRGANDSIFTETNRAPVAVYDQRTDTLTTTTADAKESSAKHDDSSAAGKDSWKWLLLGPAASK